MIWFAIGAVWAFFVALGWALARMASRKSPYEQAREDEEQARYLAEWSKRKAAKSEKTTERDR